MIQFIVTYKVADRKGFFNAIKEAGILDACNAEEGCNRYEYFGSMEDETCMILLESWRSLDDQKAHMQLPHFAKVMELEKIYGAVPTIKIHECQEIEQ